MVYSGPQPITQPVTQATSPLAGFLDEDLLNTYDQLFPEGKPQKPQYQSSSLAGAYTDFLGTPSSSSAAGKNTDWSKYVDNHSDLKQAYSTYESQAVANGDVPKPKWAWGKDHYQEFGKNENRNLTGISQNLIEEVTNPSLGMTAYDQITQAIIDRDTNNNNANAAINALNRQSDDYRTDVTAQTQLLGSLVNLQGVREGEKGALERLTLSEAGADRRLGVTEAGLDRRLGITEAGLTERLGISEAAATARQDSINETQLGVETLRGSNAIDLQEITNSGLAAVESIRQTGAANIANIQKEASNYASDSEKDWRKFAASKDAEATLGAAQAQKEGILGAAQAQKEAALGVENIRTKGALALQPIINAGLADVARLNKEASLGAAEITGKYGVEEEKVRGMSAKDVAKIQSRGNVFGSLVSAFNF